MIRSTMPLFLALFGLLAGCESPPAAPAPSAPQGAAPPALAAASSSSPAEALRQRLTNTDNGLHIRRLMILEQAGQVRKALTSHAERPPLDDAAAERLKRNGVRFLRMPLDQLDSFISQIGHVSYDANEWHGQVHEWRAVVERPVEPAGRAIAVDGVVRRYERGDFRLMMRCWTVQMEQGPFIHMELVPRRRLPQNNDLRRMLSQRGDAEQPFGSMALNLNLESGFAYVLVAEAPHIDWPETDAPNPQRAIENAAIANDPRELPQNDRRAQRGPMDMIGPNAAPPPTLGEWLLAPDREPANRTLIILIPRVAADLFLPEQLAGRG